MNPEEKELSEMFGISETSGNDQTLEQIFSNAKKETSVKEIEPKVGSVFGKVPSSAYQTGQRNVLGNIFERPSASVRGFIQGLAPGGFNPIEGYKTGSRNPAEIQSFQDLALDKYYQSKFLSNNPALKGWMGQGVSTLGMGADIATNPADLLAMIGGKIPGVQNAGKAVLNTKAAQAVSRFLNKPRSFLKFGKDAVLNISKKGAAGVDKLDDLAGIRYEQGIQKIKGTIKETKPIIDKIDEAFEMYPDESYTTLKKIKTRLTDNKKPISELSATELRNLKQEAKKGIPRSVFQGKTDATPQQAAQLRVYNQIDDELVALGGNDYIKMKSEYSEWKNTAQDAYKLLLEGGRPGDVNLRQWFGYGASRRQMKALEKVNKLLPNQDQFLQEFLAWRRGQVATKVGGALIPAGYLAHRYLAEKLTKK